jgi:serine/threonine protein phosphatase PrpC
VGNFFKKLFGPKETPGVDANREPNTRPSTAHAETSEASTAPLSEEMLAEITAGSHRIEPSQLVVGVGRTVGRQRNNNQDSIFTYTANIATESATLPFGIYLLADGMGGHRDGHIASEYAVRTMGQYLMNKLYQPIFGISPEAPSESLQEIMRQGVLEANQAVIRKAPGGGTTLTGVLVRGTQMTLAHIGDSRAYAVFLDGRMQMLTRDHSLVKRLEELGQITADEAVNHPQKSMLYRALGQSEPQEPDVFTATMPHPGYLLICSDGLWGVVEEDQIFRLIADAPNPHRACQNLMDAANANGGPDNISVILVRMSD